MVGVLEVCGYNVIVIDLVEKLLVVGYYFEFIVDIVEFICCIVVSCILVDYMVLMVGFIVGNEKGELVVFGCNGFDYFVVVLVVCLCVDCCEIWMDVDGVYICDLCQVFDVRLLKLMFYQEVMEFFYFGVKVFYFCIIIFIVQFQIFCLIKNIGNF